jgi:hypothetical protein
MNEASGEPRDLDLDLLWELPLALLSWGFFHLNKTLIALLYQVYLDRQFERSRTWQILSPETLSLPVSLPVLLTKGPRWNTHATIGTLGPLSVERHLAVQTGEANRSAEAWSVVLYHYPDFRTFRELGSLDSDVDLEWTGLDLPPGRYVLGVRYYGLKTDPRLPAVKLDDAMTDTVAAEPLPPGVNKVYETLASRTTIYHHALHHYVHTMLRVRRWLPAPLIRREFLPVGDPYTEFRYDWFPACCSLQIQVAERLLQDFRIYLTIYNRASLPIHSSELVDAGTTTIPRFDQAGFYLFRLRPRRRQLPACREDDLLVRRLCRRGALDGASQAS